MSGDISAGVAEGASIDGGAEGGYAGAGVCGGIHTAGDYKAAGM